MGSPWPDGAGVPATLVELLRRQAHASPDFPAYTFLEDGETARVRLSYAELDQRARAVAAQLQGMAFAGERVLLLYLAGLDFIVGFFACLYAGCIAVPTFPPDPHRLQRTLPRLRAIARDSRPAAALTTAAIATSSRRLAQQLPEFAGVRWLATDTIPPADAARWHESVLSATTIAFLQYTSGSTAAPKGVILTHGNLLHNLSLLRSALGVTSRSRFFSWLPLFHDMGLIGGVLTPIYNGIPLIFMSPLHFLQQPMRWLRAIGEYQITHSGGPNFGYEMCLRALAAGQPAALDLSSWDVAWNGAEPVRVTTMERFVRRFAPYRFRPEAFYPCYGLAEATLIVSGGKKTAPPVVASVRQDELALGRVVPSTGAATIPLPGCGTTLGGQVIRIVDPQTLRHCEHDRIGEIWVSGPSVAQGYWQLPQETKRSFGAFTTGTDEGPFLRTGDLGFLLDGELFIAGRLKDLIIVDGLNHYPQDIEATAEQSHPALRAGCSAAFSVDVDDRERAIVAVEVGRPDKLHALQGTGVELDGAAIAQAIRQAVSQHHDLALHDIVLLEPRTILKTSSGKIQRRACREAYLAGELRIWNGRK